jgi:hypothetical protein
VHLFLVPYSCLSTVASFLPLILFDVRLSAFQLLCAGVLDDAIRMLVALRDMTWSSASQMDVLESLRVDLLRVRQIIDSTMDIHAIRVVPQLLRMRRVTLLHLSPVDDQSDAGSANPLRAAAPAPLTAVSAPGGKSATAYANATSSKRLTTEDRSASVYAAERLQNIAAQTASSSFENAAVLDEDDDRAVGDMAPSAKGKLSILVRRTLREVYEKGADLAAAYSTVELACKEMVEVALSAYEPGTPECNDALEAAETYVIPPQPSGFLDCSTIAHTNACVPRPHVLAVMCC